MNTPVLGLDPMPARSKDDAFTASDFWKLLVDNVWVVVGFILLATGVATLYAFVATPYFSADALVKVDYPNPNALGVNAQSQQQPVPSTLPTDAEMQIIQSRAVLLPVIKKYHQDVSVEPRQFPLFGRISALFATPGQPVTPLLGLDSFAWGGEEANIQTLEVPLDSRTPHSFCACFREVRMSLATTTAILFFMARSASSRSRTEYPSSSTVSSRGPGLISRSCALASIRRSRAF